MHVCVWWNSWLSLMAPGTGTLGWHVFQHPNPRCIPLACASYFSHQRCCGYQTTIPNRVVGPPAVHCYTTSTDAISTCAEALELIATPLQPKVLELHVLCSDGGHDRLRVCPGRLVVGICLPSPRSLAAAGVLANAACSTGVLGTPRDFSTTLAPCVVTRHDIPTQDMASHTWMMHNPRCSSPASCSFAVRTATMHRDTYRPQPSQRAPMRGKGLAAPTCMAATFPTKTSPASTNGNGAVPTLQGINTTAPSRSRRPVLDPASFDAAYYPSPDVQPRNPMMDTRLRLFSGSANLVRKL